jgi:hypothetical protein
LIRHNHAKDRCEPYGGLCFIGAIGVLMPLEAMAVSALIYSPFIEKQKFNECIPSFILHIKLNAFVNINPSQKSKRW